LPYILNINRVIDREKILPKYFGVCTIFSPKIEKMAAIYIKHCCSMADGAYRTHGANRTYGTCGSFLWFFMISSKYTCKIL
jgi:hypothetical protein